MRRSRTHLVAVFLAALLGRPGLTETPHASALVEQTRSDLVLIEVYARDKKGRVVRDLRADELVLKIDMNHGVRKIESLEFVEAEDERAMPADAGDAPEGVPAPQDASVLSAGEARRQRPRRFMLFFDDDTSSPIHMGEARRAALQFLRGSGLATDQFSVVVYEQARKLEVLCPFTDDRGALARVLEQSLEDRRRFSDYAMQRVARREEVRQLVPTGGDLSGRPTAEVAPLLRQYAQEDSLRMGRVLNNLRTLVEALAGWDGYKAIVFFSDGIPENPGLDYGWNDSRRALTSEISLLAFSASSSNVVLHAVQTTGVVAGTGNEVSSSYRRSNVVSTLALNTGGIQRTTNDLKGALLDIENETHGYYLLSYLPIEPPDGWEHSINLSCKRRGVKLRYRQSFTRFTPEETRTRGVQAAYQVPEIHGALGAELSLIAGPVAGRERVVDVVIYVPAGRLLYLPQPGGAAAAVEVGFVALDATGKATRSVSRRVDLGVDTWRALHGGAISYVFYSRVRLPLAAQTVTAVISDLHSGDLGASRVALEESLKSPALPGLSLYATGEKSAWIRVEEPRDTTDDAAPAAFTLGPTLRSRFFMGEEIACAFKGPAIDGAVPMRVEVRRGDQVVRSIEVGSRISAGRQEGDALDPQSPSRVIDLPTQGLESGEYVLWIEQDRPDGPKEIGRLPFRIASKR